MKINVKQVENNTDLKNCACCDVDLNLYKVKFECLLELDLEIIALSENEAKQSCIEVLGLIDIDELVENEDMPWIHSQILNFN